jgi:membrane-bound ClpP family serine protease
MMSNCWNFLIGVKLFWGAAISIIALLIIFGMFLMSIICTIINHRKRRACTTVKIIKGETNEPSRSE